MAYYAFLDNNNVVTEVISGKDETETLDGLTPEEWYGNFRGQRCVRTSYNTASGIHLNGGTPFRKNFAAIGDVYDEQRDAFYITKPYPSWILSEETCQWSAPTAFPDVEYPVQWDESTLSWVEVILPA
jgi:hypothetical protein